MLTDEEVRKEVWQTAMDVGGNPSYMVGFLLTGGSLSLGKNHKVTLSMRTGDDSLLVASMLEQMYGYHPEIALSGRPDSKAHAYVMELSTPVSERLLADCHMKHTSKDGQTTYTLALTSMRWVNPAAFFAALYLESGRLYVSTEYRLDIVLPPDNKRLSEIEAILDKKDIGFLYKLTGERLRLSFRKDDIASFLALIGAPEASLAVTEFYFERTVNRNVTREINCRTSNMDKSFAASTEQVVAIRYLQQHGLYNLLPAPVRLVGDTRLANPEASILDLARLVGVSKITAYRRLQRIMDEAKQKGGY